MQIKGRTMRLTSQGGTGTGGAVAVRYLILSTLFLASAVNYGDRSVFGMAGAAISAALHLNPVELGYILAAPSLPYFLLQMPGGLLLDRFGARWICCSALMLLSFFTIAQGLSGFLAGSGVVVFLFATRFFCGLVSSPIVPANARLIATWFPAAERGLVGAIFNAAQYFALIIFAPLSAWVMHILCWPWAFFILGGLGIVIAAIFPMIVRGPLQHPFISARELDYIQRGGALVQIEPPHLVQPPSSHLSFHRIAFRRQLLGLYLFQYCIGVLSSFFMTWLPIYLVQHSGMSILHVGIGTAIPAVFGLAGSITGGLISDAVLRRSGSLTLARGTPVFIGFSIATVIAASNFTKAPFLVVGLMAVAFFGKGMAALGWTMVSDIAPKNLVASIGGVFNMVSALSGILAPVVMGHVVAATGSFDWAMLYVAAHCLLGMAAFRIVIRHVERIAV